MIDRVVTKRDLFASLSRLCESDVDGLVLDEPECTPAQGGDDDFVIDSISASDADALRAKPSADVVADTEDLKSDFEEYVSSVGGTVEWKCDIRSDRQLPFWYQDDLICVVHTSDYDAELVTTSPICGYIDGEPYDEDGGNPWAVVDDFMISSDADAEENGVELDYAANYFYFLIHPKRESLRDLEIESYDYGFNELTLNDALCNETLDSDILDVIATAADDYHRDDTHRIGESKKRKAKAPNGATLIKDAGDVEANVAHFNMAMGSDATCSEAVGDSRSEGLRTATPYMLRNDGKLIECAPMHPYIMRAHESADILKLIKDGDDERVGALRWFREHTGNDKLRETIDVVLRYFGIENIDAYKSSDEEILDFVRQANNLSNQEFLRLRTSSMLYGGTDKSLYARISSVDFNWYPLLSELLLTHPGIENITICKDSNTFGGRFEAYSINGVKCDHLPVDEFLCMRGAPIVEGVRSRYDVVNNAIRILSDGRTINEAYPNMHPRYLNGWYKTEITERLEDNIKNSQHPAETVVDEAPEKHQTLNGKLWDIKNNTLKPEVKGKIDAIVKDFCDGLDDNEVKYKLADVRLVGSNCSYNYTDKSDLDIHIVFDLGIYDDAEKEQMAETIYNYARSLWGKTHSVEFYGIPVEVFVETNNTVDLNVADNG